MTLKSTFLAFTIVFSAIDCFSQTSYTYTGKPRFKIETRRAGIFLGNIEVELFPNIAPKHVRNFDSLVSTGFYDTTAFHRAIPGFVIQGGDPNTRSGPMSTWGYGDPNQPTVNAEFSAAKHLRGSFSAARSNNINSATSQFFICVAATPNLNGQYSLYGRVTSGMNYADTIALSQKFPGTYSNTPLQKVEMFVTYVGSNDTVPNPPALNLPVNGTVDLDYLFPINCSWIAVSDAIIYELEVTTDSLFTTITEPLVKTANLNYALNGLMSNTKYFWRVRTNNGGHFSAYTPIRNFKTSRDPDDATGILSISAVSETHSIFPNPTTDKFGFTNLQVGNTLEIMNAEGRSVYKTTVKDPSMTIDFEGKEKGIYFYTIKTNGAEIGKGKLLVK